MSVTGSLGSLSPTSRDKGGCDSSTPAGNRSSYPGNSISNGKSGDRRGNTRYEREQTALKAQAELRFALKTKQDQRMQTEASSLKDNRGRSQGKKGGECEDGV